MKGEGERGEWADRIGRLNSAINAEVNDLMDILEDSRSSGPHADIDRVTDGLTVLGEHLRDTATDLLDVSSDARHWCQAATQDHARSSTAARRAVTDRDPASSAPIPVAGWGR